VTGLFLAVALIVEYVSAERRVRADVVALLAPAATAGAFIVYLHHVLGDWLAWPHAESSVWGRHLTAPWTALHTTWQAATAAGQPGDFSVQFGADIATLALGLVLTGYVLARRRWAEATYVGLQVAALGTSSYYLSVGRATLLWWPLWAVLGRTFARNRAAFGVYVMCVGPAMIAAAYGFTSGKWWVG
jgi:hypothetical protein